MLIFLVRVDINPDITWRDMNYQNVNQVKNPQSGISRSISAEVLGVIPLADFWASKHFAPKGIPCNITTLNEISNGNNTIPKAPVRVLDRLQVFCFQTYSHRG